MKISIDPLDAFNDVKNKGKKLLDACGLLPYFVLSTAETEPETAEEAMAAMEKCYGFGKMYDMLEKGEGTVEADGTYTYPEDPDLKPLMTFELGNDIEILLYQHAFVVVRDKETTLMVRMD
jgi:hypothetical protein